ncbi:MAG: MDR family MFS transporter [Janthinobacterium lividum]
MAVHTAAPHSSSQVLGFKESLLAMLGMCVVVMLVALDQTVVGTALPTIVAELKGFELYAWVATSYLLTSVITIPIFGRLGDYYGRKPFLVGSIVLFTAASALCGVANSMIFLVLGRALQGIGGGMLIGSAYACVPDLFPNPRVRLRWQVMISSSFGIANALGPSLGGFLTQYFGWRSVFYVNLPVGLVSLYAVWRFLPHLRNWRGDSSIRLDWPGAALIAASLGCLQLFVEFLPTHGLSPLVVGTGLGSVCAFYALWRWESKCSQPLLPVEMLRDPKLAPLFVLAVFVGFSFFSLLFYTPLLLQGGFGLSPKDAGLLITPLVVCITLGSIANGRLLPRIPSPNVMLFIGLSMMAIALLGVVLINRYTPHWCLEVVLITGGVGLGFVMPNLTIFAQQTAGREYLGIATGLMQSLRMVGGMIGTALTGSLITHLYRNNVRNALTADNASNWVGHFLDPQILVNRGAQPGLLAQLSGAGFDGGRLLDAARDALAQSIHISLALVMIVCVYAVWHAKRVPPVKLEHRIDPTAVVAE